MKNEKLKQIEIGKKLSKLKLLKNVKKQVKIKIVTKRYEK